MATAFGIAVRPVEPILFDLRRSRPHAYDGGARSRRMAARIARTIVPVTATSASWKMAWRACRAIRAPILTSRPRSEVSDHRSTPSGVASVRGKLARLQARARRWIRTTFAAKRLHESRVHFSAYLPSFMCRPAPPRWLWKASTRSFGRLGLVMIKPPRGTTRREGTPSWPCPGGPSAGSWPDNGSWCTGARHGSTAGRGGTSSALRSVRAAWDCP